MGVTQLVSAANDPSQFGATPNAALANAAARRLGGDPSGGGGGNFLTPPTNSPVNNPIAAPVNTPIMGAQPNPGHVPLGPPNGLSNTPTHNGIPALQAGVGNPLIGGTGDPNLDKYLGTDSTYQSQLSDLMRQYDQYNAQKNLTASQTQADYDAKQRALNDQATQDRLNMRNAAAARGILQSGIYANQLGQYNDTNQQQLTNLLGGLQNSRDNANLQYTQFVANEIAAKESAIQQAAARRAAQLGLI